MVNDHKPQGILGRGLRLGKLGLALSGSYLGYQAQNLWFGEEQKSDRRRLLQQKASRKVREELGALKGPLMKLGQILSMQTHALPPEVLQELAQLQMRAPGMHPTLARAQFKNSIGKYPEEVFRDFEPEPFAAASLGQVHGAITKRGEKVAVKIQYPAIRAAIENDLKLLRSATFPGRLTGHAPVNILDEIKRGFLEETDYMAEAKNLQFFGKSLAEFTYLTIPEVHWDYTTERVLTMSFVEGLGLREFLRHKPSQALRDLVGTRLVEMYQCQLQRLHALHADHHPGNYLFKRDGSIGLVDFGCVKLLKLDAADLSRCCVNRVWKEGHAKAQHVIGMIWGPKTSLAKARDMFSGLDEMVDLLYPIPEAERLVDFGRPNLLNTLGGLLTKAVRNKLTNPEFAFLSRADLGIYSLLHQLGARVNTWEIWAQQAERATSGRR